MSESAFDPGVPSGLPRTPAGSAITIGTFDGVHRGHWAVLQELRRAAREAGRRSVLVTFRPHPLRIVQPEAAPKLLTTVGEKKEILAESGLDYAVFLSFTPTLARYSARRFVTEVLVDRLQLAHLVVGYDHGLGRGRSGDVETLRRLGAELGFTVSVVPPVRSEGGPISSSRIRRALEEGDVAAAAVDLGRPYTLHAPVVRGDGRGRGLGFPTANLQPSDPDKLLPQAGIYAVRALLREQAVARAAARPPAEAHGVGIRGVLHLGPRPTFQGAPPSVELHLLDFEGDLYGEEVRVDFCARLRGIEAFRSSEALIDAIRRDIDGARALFSAGGGACQPPRHVLQ